LITTRKEEEEEEEEEREVDHRRDEKINSFNPEIGTGQKA
jgi:hypothetical protein